MSRGLGSLIAVLGTAAQGYMQGKQMADASAERKRLADQQQEEYDYQKAQRDEQTRLKAALADSQADQSVEEVTPPDMSQADISLAGAQPAQYRANGVMYGDRAQAEQAIVGANSSASRATRAADVMRKAGQVEKAELYDAMAKRALSEGTDRILSTIQAARPSVEQVKAAGGTVAGTVGQDAADVFNKTGAHWKVAPDTVVQHFIDKDAAGREFVNSRVLGKDGKPVIDDVEHAGLFLQDYKTRAEAKANDTRTYQSGLQIAQSDQRIEEEKRHNKVGEDDSRANNKAQRDLQARGLSIQARGVAVQEAKDRREAQLFKNQTPEGQIEQLKAAGISLTPDEEKQYRKKLLGIGVTKDSEKMTDALVDKLTEKFGETTTDPGAIATFRAGLQEKFAAVGNNNKIVTALKGEFTKNPFGSEGYAQTYNDAITQLRLTPADLQQMGYQPPPKATAAVRGIAMPTASGAAAPVAVPTNTTDYNQMTPAQREARWQARHAAEAQQAQQQAQAEATQAKVQQVAMLQSQIAQLQQAESQGRLLDRSRLVELQRDLARLTAQ